MEGEGMVAVVRGLGDSGLAVTLLDGNHQYTLLPNSISQPVSIQRAPVTNVNAATQPSPPKCTADSSTESPAPLCDRDAQAIDGRYTSMYKTVHCNVRPTSPPVQLTEFPPQRPDLCPGHGNFQVGGAGSGATHSHIRASSPVTSFRGGMTWPDRGSVCSPRPSHEVDAFANSLRKYPCLSPDRSSEVLERLINYTQAKGLSKTSTRNQCSPTRIPEPSSCNTLEPKGTYTKATRSYEPEVTVRAKKEDLPTRDRKNDDHHDLRPLRNIDVRCIRDMSKRMRDNVKSYSSYPYNHPVCPAIKENHDYRQFANEYQNSSNSVNMEIQAAVKMISKEVATVQREHLIKKSVAVPESPISSAGEDNVEGERYFVPNLDITTSFKSIKTNLCSSDMTLKPRKSVQTVFSTTDFHSRRNRTIAGRKTKSQEQIKVTKDELKRSLLELIDEVSTTSKYKKDIRDELIKRLFVTDRGERDIHKGDRGNSKHDKYVSTFCPTICDYVGDFQELVGKLKHCYGDTNHILRSEIKPFGISEYRQLDFVLKDWVNNLNLKTREIGRYIDRDEILNSVEDRIKVLFKSRAKQDFDLKSGIVKIIEEIPIEVNKSYIRKSYLHKLVDLLLKRMRNVIVSQQTGRIRRRSNVNRSKKILTDEDIRECVRAHLLDFFNECDVGICDNTLNDLENQLMDVMIDSIDCIRCGHVDDAIDEMNLILQHLGQVTDTQANYLTNIILQDLQEMLNNCSFNQTYMILNVNNNSGQLTNKTNNTDVSIGAITEEDLRANLDHYTNQLCQQINQWLDSLNIPQIQDKGFREVVVNDLAGDIVDRKKYIELNHTGKSTEKDDLEALKYQIFKWINKLVGDDNQETIRNAKHLLQKISSVPVPMLTYPKNQKITGTGRTPQEFIDPMRPCLGETGSNTCSDENKKLTAKRPCCMKDSKEIEGSAIGSCCKKDTCPNAQRTSGTHSQTTQGIQSQPGSLPHIDQAGQRSYGQGSGQGSRPQSFANAHRPSQGQGSLSHGFPKGTQYGYLPPGSLYNQSQGFRPGQSPYGQVVQVGPGRASLGPSGTPNQQWGPNAFFSEFTPNPANNSSQTPYGNANARTSSDKRFISGGTFDSMDPTQQSMYDPNLQSMYGAGPHSMMGGAQIPGFIRPLTPRQIEGNFNPSGIGAGTSFSPSLQSPKDLAPIPTSMRKLNEDYDNYLKQWVQQIPIAAKTPAEQQKAENSRLGIYNGIWKSVTKLKLDPNTFTNPYYYQDVFDEEMERLLKDLPKSQELNAVKPMLKAQLLQKTLAMNDQIKSTNAPASFKQQLTESIENNLPKRMSTSNEEDQQNEELEKQSLADYYILHTRYKHEDYVKATVHKNNFLKKLDGFLDKIKKRHGIVDMNTNVYANEIINSLDKVPKPNALTIKEEADDILLTLEVEKWIADLPQNPDTAGPLEKRRTRDAIVKKIQEIGANINYNDNSFAVPLKAELPKYLEKIPIQEGYNEDFMIDELANRIKNLSKSIQPRSVSFQEPQNYDEFSRNMPAASSFNELFEKDGSYFVVEGNIVKNAANKSWMNEEASAPQEEHWHSMQITQAPLDLRNWTKGPQSSYNPNISDHMPAPRSFPGGGYEVQGQFTPNAQANFSPNGRDQFSPHTQGHFVSNTRDQFAPNTQGLFPPNIQAGQVCTGTPCCPSLTYANRLQGSVASGPYSQPAGQGFPNAQSSLDPNLSTSYGQGVSSGKFPNAAPTSQLPQGPIGQGSSGSYNQSFGPVSTPFSLIQNGSVLGSQRNPQGQDHADHSNLGPQGIYDQNRPNQRSSIPGSGMHPQGLHTRYPSQVPQEAHGQGFPNVEGGAISGSQMNPQRPYTCHPSRMYSPGLHAGHPDQNLQKPYGQSFTNGQDGPVPHTQNQSFGPGEPTFGQPKNFQTFQGPYQTLPNTQAPYGQVTSNDQGRFGPSDHMPYQGANEPQIGQVYQGPYGQVSAYGPTDYNSQGYSKGHPNASAEAQLSMYSPKLNQTAQSFGPVSATSQVPDESQKSYKQEMAGGGMGILGISQEPGPSTQTESPRISHTPSVAYPNAQFYSVSEAQRPPTAGTDVTHPGFHKSTDSKENKPTDYKRGTNRKEKPPEELISNKNKSLDINEKEIFNIKSVQTAFSTIDIKTTKCKYCEIRSKSQEELTRITKTQEIIKRRDFGRGDLQRDVTEWFEIHSDKVKVKLWGEKLKKLADKLKKPGGEEKLRVKIEKYLKQVPEQFSEGDDDRLEFRKQLPNDIIRTLKKMYLDPTDANVSVYRMELTKYCSRFKIENLRKAVLKWTKTLNIKKKDFLDRNVKKDDVFKYVADKLEPLVLDRPQSDTDYKVALKSNITDIIDELPLVLNSQNKEFYLNKITENLVNDIFNIENKFPSTYIQPTIKEIKEFVKDEITFFLEKSRVAISTKRMEYLETELIDLLLDLTDITDIDSYLVDNVTTLLKEVGKLPEYKAKYFTNLLLKDYREFFFRESFFQVKGNLDHGRPAVYSAFQNATGIVDFSGTISFDKYTQQIIEKISKWITKLNIPNNDKNFIKVVVKDLASDIVDRYKYILLNPSTKGSYTEELEHLKFQIFKWTNKFVGEENTSVLEHAQELMNEIHNIPKPSLQCTSVVQSVSPQNTGKLSNKKPYVEVITDQVYDWYHELPIGFRVTQVTSLNRQLIKDFAEELEKGLEKKEYGLIDKEVSKWTERVFNKKLSIHDVEQLKNRIINIPYTKENRGNDPKHEKVIIRSYEDIVDEWISIVPIAPKKGVFASNKNEIVHEIAVKICKIKTKLNNLPEEVVEKKLQEELSHWLKKLPLHVKVDKQNYRDNYAAKLVKSIQIQDSLEKQPMLINKELPVNQVEEAMLEWLKKLPLYRKKSSEEKHHQEVIIKELANKINLTIGEDAGYDENIIEYIRILDPKQNNEFVQNTACQLKLYLQKFNKLKDLSECHNKEDDFLVSNIEVWLNNLPLNVTDVNLFKKQKTDFTKSMKRLISSGSDSAVMKKVIFIFMRTLPMSRNKKDDIKYLNQEAFKLIQSLTIVPMGEVPSQSPPKSNEIISDAIKEWAHCLPLKSVHCPRELRSFIDDMSSVITTLLFDPEHSVLEQNDARLHSEIVKFLRRFPLQHERSTESHISLMAEELAKTLKDINSFRNENCAVVNDVLVYGVSLQNTNTTDNDITIQSIKESDINKNLDTYTKQLVQQIGEWFDLLNLPKMHKESYKEVVINDLAGDIVDRRKYLELNPDSTTTKEDELEHLKYQIFKWINKLVGEENLETIRHADDLMKRVDKIPVPILVRPQDKRHAESRSSLSHHRRSQSDSTDKHRPSHEQQRSKSQTTTSLIKKTNTGQQVNDLQKFNSPTACSFKESIPQAAAKRIISPTDLASPTPTSSSSQNPLSASLPPDEGTKEAIYDKYQKVFKEKCNALPIDDSSSNNAKLAKLAKTAIYNGIIKTFFNLKSDPEIQNDYEYFEFMLEEKIEELLDVLPQSEELINKRHAWKLDILTNAMDMLDQLHSLTDRASFRQRVRNNFNRKFTKELELEQCFLLQQGFLAEVADAYILETNYKEKDNVKANIYKNRLMKKVDELANHLAKEHNVGFRFFKKAQLVRIAMKLLEQVPIPENDILQEEAEEIQLAEEVEKWYKELPTKPLVNDTDGVIRKRMMDLLANKLYDLHKRLKDQDPSKEAKMKHEISHFLEKRAQLQENQDLNINFMVDELNNRLKNRWLKEPLGYDEFEKEKPLSSTLTQMDNAVFLAPLMDAATSTSPLQGQGYQEPVGQVLHGDQGYFIQPGHSMQNMDQVNTLQGAGLYGGNGIISEMKPDQGYRHNSIPGSGFIGSPPKVNAYADNLNMSQHMPSQAYISQQETAMHSMDPNPFPYQNRMGRGGPSEGYVSQQSVRIPSMQISAIRNKYVNGTRLEASQFGLKQGQIVQPSSPGPSLSRQIERPGQLHVAQQSPQSIPSMAHTSPKNGRGTLRTSQMGSSRMQNINQAVGQNVLTNQTRHQGQLFQNIPSNIQGPYGPQGQTLFVPIHQGGGPSPTGFHGYLGSRGPTPSHGAATTAQVDPGDPVLGEDTDNGFRLKCRCFEAYRKRRRLFEYVERNDRYRPYKCPY